MGPRAEDFWQGYETYSIILWGYGYLKSSSYILLAKHLMNHLTNIYENRLGQLGICHRYMQNIVLCKKTSGWGTEPFS